MNKKFLFLLVFAFLSFSLSILLALMQNTYGFIGFFLDAGKQEEKTNITSANNSEKNLLNKSDAAEVLDAAKIRKKADTYYQYSSAILAIQNGDLDKAENTIMSLLKDNPENTHFHLAAAQMYLQKQNSQKAKSEVEYVIKQTENDYEAWRLLGLIYLDYFRKDEKQEYLDKVLDAFRNVYKYHPQDTDEITLRITSILLLEEGKNDEALIYLQKLIQNYPSHPVAVQNLERIFSEKKDLHSLLNLYKQLTEEIPEDLATQFKLADVAFKLKNYDDAEKALMFLDEAMSKSEDQQINKDNLAVIQKQLGYIFARKNKLNDALNKLIKSRKIKDDFFTTYYIILVLMQKKEYDTARKEMNIALKQYADGRDSDDLKILNCQLLQKENKNPDALKEIDRLIAADKTNLEFKLTKSRMLMNINKFDEAKSFLKELYKQYPSNTDVIFQLGMAHERLKESIDAENLLRLAIKLEPGNSAVMNYLGYMWADQGINLQEAESLIKKALDLDPTSSAYLDSLGWVYYKMGNYAKSRFFLEKAVKSGVEGGEIYDHLGDLYYKISFLEEAVEYWKKCLSENDLNLDYEKIQEKIDTVEKKLKK